jgi:hypothetical protein
VDPLEQQMSAFPGLLDGLGRRGLEETEAFWSPGTYVERR